jgi:hypothetical protein
MATETAGLQEARRGIEAAARKGAEELDLGGLGLTEIPEEQYAQTQLRRFIYAQRHRCPTARVRLPLSPP